MKHKFFYSHLVQTSDIKLRLSELNLSKDEKVHLTSLLEANIHTTVINTVLSELPEEDKKTFLKNLVEDNHGKIWEHLNSRIGKLEEKIKISVKKLRTELLEDLISAKRLSEEDKS